MQQIPASVYRLQMSDLTFKEATKLIPYLHQLGIEGVYCSPIFQAYSYGYDVTNPNKLDPSLGSAVEYDTFCQELSKHGMQQILDLIPNHMGIKGETNVWFRDVLEKGAASPFAEFFDIDWAAGKGKVVLTILDRTLDEALTANLFELVWKEGFFIRVFDFFLPVSYATYGLMVNTLLPATKAEFIKTYKAGNIPQSGLKRLLEHQFYRLEPWTQAGKESNYRRFFNINELIAIHIEKKTVFDLHHKLAFELLAAGKVQGLRIDHPDGLWDPATYLARVRAQNPALIWVEKILDFDEPLPETWEVSGTVGYDFLNALSGVFIDQTNDLKMTAIYDRFTGETSDFKQTTYQRRKRYLALEMTAEINRLISLLSEPFPIDELYRACVEIIACFPVYRTYIKPDQEVRQKDRDYIRIAVFEAKQNAPELPPQLFEAIQQILLLEKKAQSPDFLFRFQQLTAPVMAKSLEDSTFYLYNRLISLNEVGGSPAHFGCSPEHFHQFNQQKLANWPLGALASTTHDTKYSEDARLRLHALSEIPEIWEQHVQEWKQVNKVYKKEIEGTLFPDLNTEYLLYQLLLAAWPATIDRLWTCFRKIIREAGIYTSWHQVNHDYEEITKQFLLAVYEKPPKSFLLLQKKLAKYGAQSSLSALVLKIGSCGIVDIYQGDEWLNYSLVDPDNRRPVDFAARQKELRKPTGKADKLKMGILAKGLHFRKEHKELFLEGEYIPLRSPPNVIAFRRKWQNQEVVILVRRFFSQKHKAGQITLPHETWRDIFTGELIQTRKNKLHLSEVFKHNHFAILEIP